MFQLDSHDPTPLYAQLERAIRTAVATGALAAGDRLPTVRQLAVDLRVNANTVARVYGELERAGLLETRRGVGTFVASPGVGAAGRPELKKRLDALGDRYLSEAQALGFSAREAIAALEARLSTERGRHGDHTRG
ncbi:GntR family transcriptional regulator [Paludisphaera mucosa]|uniref:GntR family transcriptional regulator n=1 Tax=Paludisphaera mucosa TaxID=3030827 RepID=A0ABT6F432_9BACT|nr:GntR family transcriptional regulator [Paludisphaera mucosa]